MFIKKGKKLLLVVSLMLMCMAVYAQESRDGSNMLIGKIEPDGTLRDRSNMMIGKVDSDGDVKDMNYMQIGRVWSDATVVDRSNRTIDYVKDIPTTYAAVFFFFKLFE